MKESHPGFTFKDSGLFIDTNNPFLGASPDGIAQCDCCEERVVEIKCPYCFKEGLPDEDSTNFCMVNKEGKWSLKQNHAYFYQVQLQLHVCNLNYADFVLWTKQDTIVERLDKNSAFIREKTEIVKYFFTNGCLPEIVGKWYSRGPVADSTGVVPIPRVAVTAQSTGNDDDDDDPGRSWCYCSKPSFGEMIMCDNKQCTIIWFHFDCLELRAAPKGKWYCPSCRLLPKFNRSRKK